MSLFTNCFRVLSTSQVAYIRRQSDAQLSRSNAREICACDRCRVIGVKIISLCYIISLFSHILRVRFGSGVGLEPKEKLNMFQLRKSLKVGQTTVFCRAQDYRFLISDRFCAFRSWICIEFYLEDLFPFFTFHVKGLFNQL